MASKQYVCIAKDTESTQEGIFISTNTKNPRPLLVFHDLGETKKQLIKTSESIASSMVALFREAHIKNRNRTIPEENFLAAQEGLTTLLDAMQKTSLSSPNRIPNTHTRSEQDILLAIIETKPESIASHKLGAFLERLANDIPALSIPGKRGLWEKVHELYDTCALHKGDLYFHEAHAMI